MEYRNIPNLNIPAARIGLGTWAIGGWMWGGTDVPTSIATIHKALDLGINLIDTAPIYGFGLGEEIVGKALQQYGRRSEIIIATKTGLGWQNNRLYRDARQKSIVLEIEASLKRLQLEYIDLYQVHWPDPLTPLEETADALQQLLEQGKIRAIGVSNFSTSQMEEFQNDAPLHTLQSPYNLFETGIETNELAYCQSKSIATLGTGSLCRGLLSGKMTKDRQFIGDDIRKFDPKFREPRFSDYLLCVQKLEEWSLKKYNKPLYALAIRYALDKGISVALWGARRPEQLEEIEAVWRWSLWPEDFAEIEQIKKETLKSPVGPEFMAPPSRLGKPMVA